MCFESSKPGEESGDLSHADLVRILCCRPRHLSVLLLHRVPNAAAAGEIQCKKDVCSVVTVVAAAVVVVMMLYWKVNAWENTVWAEEGAHLTGMLTPAFVTVTSWYPSGTALTAPAASTPTSAFAETTGTADAGAAAIKWRLDIVPTKRPGPDTREVARSCAETPGSIVRGITNPSTTLHEVENRKIANASRLEALVAATML